MDVRRVSGNAQPRRTSLERGAGSTSALSGHWLGAHHPLHPSWCGVRSGAGIAGRISHVSVLLYRASRSRGGRADWSSRPGHPVSPPELPLESEVGDN